MQCVSPRVRGWGRLNLVCNTEAKIFEDKRKHGMTRRVDSQALAPGSLQDLKHAQCESKHI